MKIGRANSVLLLGMILLVMHVIYPNSDVGELGAVMLLVGVFGHCVSYANEN